MSGDRPWYREPETFVAIAALIVSVSAVVVGIYEAALQRAHDRAEVWPHVELSTYVTPQGAALYVENTGIGPAIIKSVIVTVDGKPRRNWDDVMQALLGHAPKAYSNSTVADRALRAGDKVTMVALATADLPQHFWESVARVGVTICYGSVFDEFWSVQSARLGGQSVWVRAAGCAAQPQGVEF